jgi:hypothetical protein
MKNSGGGWERDTQDVLDVLRRGRRSPPRFDRKFLQTVITRVDANEEIYKKILDDEDFRACAVAVRSAGF